MKGIAFGQPTYGMRILFTPMNERYVLGVCDVKARKTDMISTPQVIEDHRPFGLTWSRNLGSLFVAQPTSVWEFDFDLKFKRVISEGLWYGLHQMVCVGRELWIVSPRINGIQKMDFSGRPKGYFFPNVGSAVTLPESFAGKDRLSYHEDVAHYNSILHHNNHLYLTAHNHDKSSFIEVFDQNLAKKRTINGIGTQAHNVLVSDGVWWVDSLGRKALVCEDGRAIKVGDDNDFVRGLAGTPDYFFTTKFNYSKSREGRRSGDAELIVVQRKPLRVIDRIKLPGVGNVNDIRLMDVVDFGHNVPPMTRPAIF